MADDEVVDVKVFDEDRIHVLYEGKVSVGVSLISNLAALPCFDELCIGAFIDKETGNRVDSFKGLRKVELVACATMDLFPSDDPFVLYTVAGDDECVLRKSQGVPSCDCAMMILSFLSDEECQKAFRCETLENLEFFFCKLEQIPKEIGKMKKLRSLRQYGWSLRSCAEEMGQLSSLKELRIEHCAIQELPKSIGRLHGLEKLKLKWLKSLSCIPDEVGQLVNLKELQISFCDVTALPNSFCELKSLQTLNLRCLIRAQISPVGLAVVSKLKHLHIESCNVLLSDELTQKAFFDALKRSTTLQSLILQGISLPQEEIFSALQENGSIVAGGGIVVSEQVNSLFKRNKTSHERARQCVECILMVKYSRRCLHHVQKEIVQIISKIVWETRFDYDVWSSNK